MTGCHMPIVDWSNAAPVQSPAEDVGGELAVAAAEILDEGMPTSWVRAQRWRFGSRIGRRRAFSCRPSRRRGRLLGAALKPAIAAAQLHGNTTFQDLRHTFASTATVDLYGHLVPEASGRVRDALDKPSAGTRVCALNVPLDATESR